MPSAARILLASHGTPGALAADRLALGSCARGGVLWHLVVVPDLWRGMMGDDWLNNASTRDDFGRHLESELANEIERHRQGVAQACAGHGVAYESTTVLGQPARALLDLARTVAPDLVVIGSPRPRGAPGLRSRMDTARLLRTLAAPLLIAPRPR